MKASFLLMAATSLAAMGVTAVTGLLVEGAFGFERHFHLGVLTSFFACFVHVIAFMYFVVQEKIIRQACLSEGLDVSFHERAMAMKSRAVRLSVAGIGSLMITAGLGAAVGVMVPAIAHLVAAFAAILVNGFLAVFQYALIDEFTTISRQAFPEG